MPMIFSHTLDQKAMAMNTFHQVQRYPLCEAWFEKSHAEIVAVHSLDLNCCFSIITLQWEIKGCAWVQLPSLSFKLHVHSWLELKLKTVLEHISARYNENYQQRFSLCIYISIYRLWLLVNTICVIFKCHHVSFVKIKY